MMKKANFLSAQGKEDLPECETIEVFTDEELEKFKAEAFRTHSTGNRIYQQAPAFILMLNTGLRTGEILGVLNSDIDLENKTMTIRQGANGKTNTSDGFFHRNTVAVYRNALSHIFLKNIHNS